MSEQGVFYERCPHCGSYKTEPAGTEGGDPYRKCKSCGKGYVVTPFSHEGRKVRIEFEEVAGYPQEGTVRVWVDGEEVRDPFLKLDFIKMVKK